MTAEPRRSRREQGGARVSIEPGDPTQTMPSETNTPRARTPGDKELPSGSTRVIRVRGARTHNLRNVDVDIPRDQIVVLTGASGSGKSSLAFDTIFAEGQRRYVESLSLGARHFISQLPAPDVDLVEGLSPTIALEQGGRGRNPRSTVGTATEAADYLRLLFARCGTAYSHITGAPMTRYDQEQIVEQILALEDGTKFSVLAPVHAASADEYQEQLTELRRQGFVRVAIDEEVFDLDALPPLESGRRYRVEVYVDRLVNKDGVRSRLADSVDLALKIGDGIVKLAVVGGQDQTYSTNYAEPTTGLRYPELTPASFSPNSPHGACPRCGGLATLQVPDLEQLIPDPKKSVREGALAPWSPRPPRPLAAALDRVAAATHIDLYAPWNKLGAEEQTTLLYGEYSSDEGRFEGLVPWLTRRLEQAQQKSLSDDDPDEEAAGPAVRWFREEPCHECLGSGLRQEARMVRIGSTDLPTVMNLSCERLLTWFGEAEQVVTSGAAAQAAASLLSRLRARVGCLVRLGLGYLSLSRRVMTLSGGEAQRMRLATQVGSALSGVTYVLDEPTVGLHPRDTDRLIAVLKELRAQGNSLLVVEHDDAVIRAADQVIELGPGAGRDGGRLIGQGSVADLVANPDSPTGSWLAGRRSPWPRRDRNIDGASLLLRGASGHNLRNVDLRIPLGCLTCVSGVSGSGKSSLIIDTLLPAVRAAVSRSHDVALPHQSLEGVRSFERVIAVDQSSISKSPRSNPATFTGIFADIRQLFADLKESRVRGYGTARFSFNVKGGRCELCAGEGQRKVEMHFLPDLFVRCEQCEGRRYNKETCQVRYRGRNIAEVLELSVAEACEFFHHHAQIRARLEVMRDLGLGYLPLGQSARSLSGGESQRIKLARELARTGEGKRLFILDEPTTGLHVDDVFLLLEALQRLVDAGHTVVVIEHDLEVLTAADYLIEVGPDAGERGGEIVAQGRPEDVAPAGVGHTAHWLKERMPATVARPARGRTRS